MYTKKEVRNVRFQPFVYDGSNQQVPVMIERMTQKDAELTNAHPLWQTSWTSEYLGDPRLEKYAAKVGDELIRNQYFYEDELMATALTSQDSAQLSFRPELRWYFWFPIS